MDQPLSMSREVSMWIVRYLRTMSREVSVSVAGGGDASVSMEPYRWSRTNGSATIYVSRLSATIYEVTISRYP